MRQLSGLDAAFLHLETPRSPMHIGGVYLLDAGSGGAMDYARFRRHIEARLPRLGVFRERLAQLPLDLAPPFWIRDPDFDLDAHLPRIACPRPGGKAELMELAARIFARPLNRSRPLWEIAFVEGVDRYPGLARGSCALVSRAHHAAVDGVSGAEVMGALLDLSPTPAGESAPDRWKPEPEPTAAELLARATAGFGRRTLDLPRFLARTAAGGVRLALARGTGRIDAPVLPLQAPRSPLNQLITARRVFGAVELPLAAVKAVRSRLPGSTVNDVLLAVCSGALRRHLARARQLPASPLVAMVPISVRPPQARRAMGNQVSAMLVPLATDRSDPRQRLRAIHRGARSARQYSAALPAEQLVNHLPLPTNALAARLYARTSLAARHRPFFNLVITNVPGPPQPLFFAGAPLRSVFGTAPLLNGLGLILVIFSQGGRISVALTACPRVVSDAARFEDDLRAAFAELEALPAAGDPQRTGGDGAATLAALRRATAALGHSVDRLLALDPPGEA